MVVCCLVWCGCWANVGCVGILHCCRRARGRREDRRRDRRLRRLQQEEDRRERRYEREIDQRQRRQHRGWIAADQRSQRGQRSQWPMIEKPASTHVALSAVPSSHIFNNRSRQGTLGASAGLSTNSNLYGHSPVTTNGGRDMIESRRNNTAGLPTESGSIASYKSQSSRRRLQRQRRSHSLNAWAQLRSYPDIRGSLDSVTIPTPAHTLERRSQSSIGLASNASSRRRLLSEA